MTNREVAGSTPARGSIAQPANEQHPATVPTQLAGAPVAGQFSGTWHYVIVRRELSGGALLAQILHASGESVDEWRQIEGRLPKDTRGVVLVATKEQLAEVIERFTAQKFAFARIDETDGPLAGSTTAVGIVVADREFVKPFLGHLKPWRAP